MRDSEIDRSTSNACPRCLTGDTRVVARSPKPGVWTMHLARSAFIHGEAPSRTMRPVPTRYRQDSELIPRVSARGGPCRRSRRFAKLGEA